MVLYCLLQLDYRLRIVSYIHTTLLLNHIHVEISQQIVYILGPNIPQILLVQQTDPTPGEQAGMGYEISIPGINKNNNNVLTECLYLVLPQVVVLCYQSLPLVDQSYIFEPSRLCARFYHLALAVGEVTLGCDVQESGLYGMDGEYLLDFGHQGYDHVLGLQLHFVIARLYLHQE